MEVFHKGIHFYPFQVIGRGPATLGRAARCTPSMAPKAKLIQTPPRTHTESCGPNSRPLIRLTRARNHHTYKRECRAVAPLWSSRSRPGPSSFTSLHREERPRGCNTGPSSPELPWEDSGSCSDGDGMLRPRAGGTAPRSHRRPAAATHAVSSPSAGLGGSPVPRPPLVHGPQRREAVLSSQRPLFVTSAAPHPTLSSIFSIASPNNPGGRDDPISQMGRLRYVG